MPSAGGPPGACSSSRGTVRVAHWKPSPSPQSFHARPAGPWALGGGAGEEEVGGADGAPETVVRALVCVVPAWAR
ncbi:MAG: hypothetical protein ACYDAD_04040 [Acidimicrobiales bacterium]